MLIKTENNEVIDLDDYVDVDVYAIDGEYQIHASLNKHYLDDKRVGYLVKSTVIASFKDDEDAKKALKALHEFMAGNRFVWNIKEFKNPS